MTILKKFKSYYTYCITVTYDNRFKFLQQAVAGAIANGVYKVIIVDNGSTAESKEAIQKMKRDSNDQVTVLDLLENRGSAGGYKAGMEYAMGFSECEYIWLLDDDNCPAERALTALLSQYARLSHGISSDRLALLSLRSNPTHRDVALGVSPKKVFPRKSSFLWFHLLNQPRRLLEIFHLECTGANQKICRSPIEIPFAPYGGLFFHKNIVSRIGYPDEQFFLYNDDTEYTFRFIQNGGKIFLVPLSVVNDLEPSWNHSIRGETFFSRLLITDSTFRIYYATRNQVYIDSHFWAKSPLMYMINKWTFLVILLLFALGHGKWKRYAFFAHAVRDGEQGRLGRRRSLENV